MKSNDSAEQPWQGQGLRSTPRHPAGPRPPPFASPFASPKQSDMESANRFYQSPQYSTPVRTGSGDLVKPREDDGTSIIPQASGATQKTSSQEIDTTNNAPLLVE